jgi:Flp pilus assembly protein TadG
MIVLRRPFRCMKGVAAVEFALALPVLALLIIGTLEFGYRIYAMAIVNGALREASRMASTGQYTASQINSSVTDAIQGFRKDAVVTIVTKSYSNFTGVGVAEPVTSGTVASGTYCYQDINGNGQWDADQGTSGLGNADDVVYYQVTATYDTLFAYSEKMFGLGPKEKISANTLVSNEPFAPPSSAVPPTKCVG